ncbi:MAG: hypothetical protein ACLR6J_00380 [Parabacteroides merdae]
MISTSPDTQQGNGKSGSIMPDGIMPTLWRPTLPHLCTDPETKQITKCGKFQLSAAGWLKTHPHTRAVFEWARGHAKSTHISLMIPIWLMIQERRTIHVMVLASKSEDSADRLLSDLQCELEFNALLKSDFNIKIDEGSWSTGEFKTADGMYFGGKGRGQSPRGIKNRGQRTDHRNR